MDFDGSGETMVDTSDLTAMLAVIDSEARTHEDIFTGPAIATPHGRAFGGQVLGQGLVAAGATVPEERGLHSMHGYFLRPGDAGRRMTFEVARLYDGRSFSTRRTQVYQNGDVIMSMIASFQEPAEGLEHQAPYDIAAVPAPETFPAVWDKYGHLADGGRASWVLNRPFDLRYVDPDILLAVEEPASTQRVWLRSREAVDGSQLLHSAALALASDYLLIEPLLRKHGIPWATPGMKAASLDHAMWFHRPFRVDDWLLYVLETPTSQAGRGLSTGRFYDRSGELVASVAQEAMLRPPEGF